jgi:putative methyltransferase (TIGR04325 family)
MISFRLRLLDKAGSIPAIGLLAKHIYERRFFRQRFRASKYLHRRLRGVYPDFASARASAPRNSVVGHDHALYVRGVTFAHDRVHSSDYPVMYWLARLLKPGMQIFDWGGNAGISYHAYQRYLDFPKGLKWVVNDVPSVVAVAKESHSTAANPGLEFTTDVDEIKSADILLAAGSLQFIEKCFTVLRDIRPLPPHIILNKVPIYEVPDAVTLLNNGTTYVPCRLFERSALVATFTELGYKLVDTWANPDLGCWIPFHPKHAIESYTGMYFSRDLAG